LSELLDETDNVIQRLVDRKLPGGLNDIGDVPDAPVPKTVRKFTPIAPNDYQKSVNQKL